MTRRPRFAPRSEPDALPGGGLMRLFCAIRATVLLVCAAGTTSHADGLRSTDSAGSGATPQARAAACNCPVYRSRVHRVQVRRYREWPTVSPVAVPEPPDNS